MLCRPDLEGLDKDLLADATAVLAGHMINAHALAKASFAATYGRPKAK